MLKFFYLLPLLVIGGLFFASCTSSSSNPVTPPTTGSIYVQSTPTGAHIWVDGTNSTKITPDSVTNLSAGNHTVILKDANYFDDTSSVAVTAGFQSQLGKNLVSDFRLFFDSVKIWESLVDNASQPSAIILKSGTTSSYQLGSNAGADIYYSTGGGLVLKSMLVFNSRSASFSLGFASNLFDRIPAIHYPNNQFWIALMSDQTTNYFYIFDNDQHYSKMIITERSPTGVSPKWIKVRWYYNTIAGSQSF